MKRNSLIATSLISTFLTLITPLSAHADKKVAAVKCKPTKVMASKPMLVSPPTALLKRGPRQFTLTTNCGDIVIQTNYRLTRVTLTALSTIINSGYYNRSFCHRLTVEDIYILQCGDPSMTGKGDPGFSYGDENLPKAVENNYPEGTVAMANSGPSTNGSQFFITYEDTTLGPNYTIWGRVTSGLEIVKYIAEGGVVGAKADGRPIRPLVIERISIS
ncbi:MAG: peptidylprolyl isomerase [Actinobacteria bacterium]|jgi:peptidyl-prolyl cis-trans isomerase B (cyclophilin B)|nr:peptidylprolyl isomerase [Actinomycetota bacterium]